MLGLALTTRSYRMDHDLGFAPNPFFGWCTLACCMAELRKYSAIGDVIVGIAGSGKQGLHRIHRQLIYWMVVEDDPSFDRYWNDPRFSQKRPRLNGPKMWAAGDRTYRHEPGEPEWRFEQSMHYVSGAAQPNGGHVVRDTKVDRVLVGRTFTYWGKSGPRVPDHLIGLFPATRHYKNCPPGPDLDELHQLMGLNAPLGLAGDPADWVNRRYFTKMIS